MALLTEIRRQIPKVSVLFAGLVWAALIWEGYRSHLVTPGNIDTAVVLQYYDRTFRLVEAGQRGNAFEKWLVGADEKWLRESANAVRTLYKKDLGDDAEYMLRVFALRLGDGFTEEEKAGINRDDLARWLKDGHGRAWHFDFYLATGDDPEIGEPYRRSNDILLDRFMGAGFVYFATLGVGLVCALLWIFGKRRDDPRASRIPDAWPVVSVLGLYFLAEILLNPWLWVIGAAYQIFETFGGMAELNILYDLLWRGFAAIFLTVLFLKNPAHLWRVFGLGRRVDWLLVLAALAVIGAIEWALIIFAPISAVDPTDFMVTAQPTIAEMVALLCSAVVFAPVFEELVFRGFIFQGLRKKTGAVWAAVISTILFALIHTQYDLWGWISVALTGAAACYLTLRTGSLKSAIALHAATNLFITLDVYLIYQYPL